MLRKVFVLCNILIVTTVLMGCQAAENLEEIQSNLGMALEAVETIENGEPMIAFVNVNVLPMDSERVLEDYVVLVNRDRIVAVGSADEAVLPDVVEVIDGNGGYLMPGLADMHVHLWERDPDPGHLALYLAEGTTTVRALSGRDENAMWRELVADGALLGPTILSAGNIIIDGLDDWDQDFVATQPVFIPESPAAAAAEVQRQAGSWGDLIKVYDGLSEETYLTAIAAAKDAGGYVVAHALDEATLETIMTSGVDEIAHLDELNFYHWIGFPNQDGFAMDYDAIPETAALMKAEGVNIVSNLSTDEVVYEIIFDTDAVLARPEYREVRPDILDYWRTEGRQFSNFVGQGPYRRDVEMPFFKALIRGLQDAGVTITIGTDTSRLVEGTLPSQIHRELELLVEAGFSPYEALAAGTQNAGRIVGRMDRDGRFGTIAEGQRADLLLLPANPLEDVSRTQDRVGVMVQGRWFTQDELDKIAADFVAIY